MKLLFLPLLLCSACSHMSAVSSDGNAETCSQRGGTWTSFRAIYPESMLGDEDKNRFVCRLPTPDGGKSCSGQLNECKGDCLAPKGTVVGQSAIGTCSSNYHRLLGELLVIDGEVRASYPITE